MRVDIVSANLGTIIIITAASRRGRAWMAKNILADGRGEQVQCEHRYGIDILVGALASGLRVKDAHTGAFATASSRT